MKQIFNENLKAFLTLDEDNLIRQINYTDDLYLSETENLKSSSKEYLEKNTKILNIQLSELTNPNQWVEYDNPIKENETSYRLFQEKSFFDSTTYSYHQTYLNVPIWRKGISLTIKKNPNRIVTVTNTNVSDVKLDFPSIEKIDTHRKFFINQEKSNSNEKDTVEKRASEKMVLREILISKPHNTNKSSNKDIKEDSKEEKTTLIRGRFYIYKYISQNRQLQNEKDEKENNSHSHQRIDIPEVDKSIQDGNYYMVTEITFDYKKTTWLALLEVETNSILYIESLASGINGFVYLKDPVSETANTTNSTDQPNTVLNPLRDSVFLPNLDAPIANVQSLRGSFAHVTNVEDPNIAPPTNPSGVDFNYNARSNNFAAVNAYFHTDRFFTMVEDLGFPISTYFSKTNFPVSIDHRGRRSTTNGLEINAHCNGNGTDGIGHCCYMLTDLTDTTNPLGIAADWKVVLHELGGHGILYEFVGSPNFGFAHSAGDTMAMLINDPDNAAGVDRFELTPWNPVVRRRSDREVGLGWAWGGVNDAGGYLSEQILSTTLFRIYRSIGGDSSNLNRRKFASEMMAYLILRTVSTFSSATNPSNPLSFCNAMMGVDLLNWTSKGIFGGAYNKVIRWGFEKQGLFQPSGAPTPVTTEGTAPEVDVYIEDGRQGEYAFQQTHWNCQSIWNRRNADGSTLHEEPILGQTNYAYVKIKNRGSQTATGIVVNGFHCLPGAGLTWPNDFQQMVYTGASIPNVAGNHSQEIIVGPFEWTPNSNAYGHDCMIFVSSAVGDSSNVDHFTVGENIEEWRLVPNDNNIAQRNVNPVPGGGGLKGLISGLHNKVFWIGNSENRLSTISLSVQLPTILIKKGWKLNFQGIQDNSFKLKSGKKQAVIIDIVAGEDFTKKEIEETENREISISVFSNESLIGGMNYYLDPEINLPINENTKENESKCLEKAKDLLGCLNIQNQDVKDIQVKKISLDILLENEECGC